MKACHNKADQWLMQWSGIGTLGPLWCPASPDHPAERWLPQSCAGILLQPDSPSSLALPQGTERPANCFQINCCLNKDAQRNSSHTADCKTSCHQSSHIVNTTADGLLAERLQKLERCFWRVKRAAANEKPRKDVPSSPRRRPHPQMLPSRQPSARLTSQPSEGSQEQLPPRWLTEQAHRQDALRLWCDFWLFVCQWGQI